MSLHHLHRLPTALFLLGLAVLTDAATARAQSRPNVRPAPTSTTPAKLQLGTAVPLKCDNPGSHQDVSKTPIITNNTKAKLPAGMTIRWRSTDNDSASITLSSDLGVGETIKGIGKAGNAYSCTADFLSLPDLFVMDAYWKSNNEVVYKYMNRDYWVEAPPSVVRIEVRACGSHEVLHTRDLGPTPLGPMSSKAPIIPMQISKPAKSYLRVIADATQKVIERDETNNTWEDLGVCVH